MKIDVKNTDPKYWEDVLKKHDLKSVDDVEEIEGTDPVPTAKFKDDNDLLRHKLDGNDQFFDGHQIKKIRVMEREEREWAMNHVGLRTIIERSFPSWRTNKTHRERAARWIRVLYLFHRVRMSRNHIAKEMKTNVDTIKNILNRSRRAASGRKADNTGFRKGMTPS